MPCQPAPNSLSSRRIASLTLEAAPPSTMAPSWFVALASSPWGVPLTSGRRTARRSRCMTIREAQCCPGWSIATPITTGLATGAPGDDLCAAVGRECLTLQSARNARASLYSGVTTIRENGPKNITMFRLRDAINAGLAVGPRMVLCGRPVAIIGGHMGYFGGEANRSGRDQGAHSAAHQGGGGLHQDYRHRRKHPDLLPAQAVVSTSTR